MGHPQKGVECDVFLQRSMNETQPCVKTGVSEEVREASRGAVSSVHILNRCRTIGCIMYEDVHLSFIEDIPRNPEVPNSGQWFPLVKMGFGVGRIYTNSIIYCILFDLKNLNQMLMLQNIKNRESGGCIGGCRTSSRFHV